MKNQMMGETLTEKELEYLRKDEDVMVAICMGGPKPYDARDFIEELVDRFTGCGEEDHGRQQKDESHG